MSKTCLNISVNGATNHGLVVNTAKVNNLDQLKVD